MTHTDPNQQSADSEQIQDDAVIAKALKWSALGLVLLATVGGAAYWYLTRPEEAPPVVETKKKKASFRALPPVDIPSIPFKDITTDAGIDFVHENGAYGRKFLPETMSGGCAFLDFDADGDADILLTSFQRWEWDKRPTSDKPATAALYENDGTGNFKNVTADSGLDVPLYGNGVACGDYDNDGLVDVYITTIHANHLFHNEGGGKFKDVSESSAASGPDNQWSTSCGWFDYDLDGDLDLFVCNYLKWSKQLDEELDYTLDGTLRGYGRPADFEGVFPDLYRNDGDGKFTDVSRSAGIEITSPSSGEVQAKSLGLGFSDFNNDGFLDVVVANDTVPNMLLMNSKDGTFSEQGDISGIAYGPKGETRGAMGIDIGHARNSEAATVAIGNYSNEMTAFYVSAGSDDDVPQFSDESVSNGIGPMTRVELTFGVFFLDVDLDGRLDLFAANGHLEDDINKVQSGQHYEQPPQLLWNCGPKYDSEFMVVGSDKCGEDFCKPMVARGTSYADIDGDGDLDILMAACGQPARLLRNDQENGNHWLRVKLIGSKCNKDAIGAKVIVELDDGTLLRKTVVPTCSYQSQVELPLTFGLGVNEQVSRLSIFWPGGEELVMDDVKIDRLLTIEE